LHARILKHWGFEKLGRKIYDESIGEMKHADKLMQRILLLGGLPNLQDLGKLRVGEDVPEALSSDLALESAARKDVVAAIAKMEAARDFVSRELAVDILEDAEEHIDFL
jgi:bacterioferritin